MTELEGRRERQAWRARRSKKMAKEVRREVTKPAVSMAGGGKPKDDHRSILFCIGYGGRMRSIVVRQGSMRERKTEK